MTLSGVAFTAEKPVRYAVIVGVREYDHSSLPKLKFTENDATELAALLRKGGYVVELLCDSEGVKHKDCIPTKQNIEAKLDAVLAKCRRDDLVLVAFAGHGVQFEKLPDCYFCPRDAKPFEGQIKTLISLDDLYQKFKVCNAGAKVLLADCCRNDPAGGRGAKRSADNLLQKTPPRGIYSCFSCSQGETAYEHPDLGGIGHGVFFHHVLEGLRGNGHPADEPIGFLTLMEKASRNVEKTVSEKIRNGAEQHPNLKFPDISGQLILLERAVSPSKSIVSPVMPSKKDNPPTTVDSPKTMSRLDITARGVSASEAQQAQKQAGETLGIPSSLIVTAGATTVEFVIIPPGEFVMGGRKVILTQPYYMSITEITQKQYAGLAATKPKPSFFQASSKSVTELRNVKSTDDFPVENVSHAEAITSIEKLFGAVSRALPGKKTDVRLPTEAEWEFACRAGALTSFHTGEDSLRATNANSKASNLNRTEKVKSYPANAFGLFDMHGNVAEWCADEFVAELGIRDETDPLRKSPVFALQPKFVIRGGSWQDDSDLCSAAARGSGERGDQRTNQIGFRVVIAVPASKDK